jgi:uncharacterized protein YciU (UPF0263 family)
MMRPGARAKMFAKASPTTRSEGVCPGPLGVGRIGKHAQHAVLADTRDRREIGRLAVDRRLIELEVAGVKDRAEFGMDRERAATGQTVVDVDELGLDRTVADRFSRLYRDEEPVARFLILQLRTDQRERKRRTDDRNVELAQEVRDAADVIFVTVRYEQRAELVDAFAQIRKIVDDDVDAEHVVVGEHQAAVDHHDVVARLDDGHVAADFAAPAERDDSEVRPLRRLGDDERGGRRAAVRLIQKTLPGLRNGPQGVKGRAGGFNMPNAAFVTLLALTLSASPQPGRPKAERHVATVRSTTSSPDRTPANQLFARRERRRIAAYLRMRLLEMREEGLARAADAVERRLGPSVLGGSH